ncbi:uncharacterized protein LOC121786687 [Salvia splendens]|uniref:uncharacterized protein LOC121786687 n=1 Tax=Salvia splendens TaxID=180675 RepID=UPI001C265499|nr:uncharacterized protein LOC121786687 [Salvia splendens]
MIVATWNIRGLQALLTQVAIVDFVRTHKIDVMGLLEMKFTNENYTFFLANNLRDWKTVDNFELIENSRMLLIWNPSKVELEPIRVEQQAIYAKIRCLTSNNLFHFVLVYVLHTIPDRRPHWDSLVEHVMQDEPTLVSGDFNNVLAEDERVGGSVPTEYEFKNIVDTCALLGLEDIMATGCKYTWTNHTISSKIDRAMNNDAWFTKGYLASTEFLPSGPYTDHSPAVTTLFGNIVSYPKPFKFFNFWLKHARFNKLVEVHWASTVRGKAQFVLAERGKEFKKRDDTIIRDQQEIINEFVDFYSTLLGTKKTLEPIKVDINRQGPLVSEEDSRDMVRAISVEEIKEALFGIGNDKAPGPDGYSSTFFKKQWERVGKDVVDAVNEFFETGQLLKNFNTTVISLIPKTSINPTVGDYRPISCCNVFYKIITKILLRRMDKLVHKAQSAFIPGTHYGQHQPRARAYGVARTMNSNFNFHAKCTSQKITHLAFADDLMLFSRGDYMSMPILVDAMEEFSGCAGLEINKDKSNLFSGGKLPPRDLEEVQSVFGFPSRSLPVKYLGVPLASSKLNIMHYTSLIDKIAALTKKWTGKNLSDAS